MPHGISSPVASTVTWPGAVPEGEAAELGRLPGPSAAGSPAGPTSTRPARRAHRRQQCRHPAAPPARRPQAGHPVRGGRAGLGPASRRLRTVGMCGVIGAPEGPWSGRARLGGRVGGAGRRHDADDPIVLRVGLPAPSLFDVVSHSAPSGGATIVRSRPYAPIR
jgi:hypothetical protein